MGNYCVRAGLGPRPWWYIPESGVYHQSKLIRQGPAGPAFCRRKEVEAPARLAGPGMCTAETTRVASRNGAAGSGRTAAPASGFCLRNESFQVSDNVLSSVESACLYELDRFTGGVELGG